MATDTHSSTKKGQAAVEVLVYVGFFLLVFVVINLFFILQVGQDISQRQYLLAQDTAGQLSDDVQLALLAGPGFNASFRLPQYINGRNYSAEFYNSSLYVDVASAPIVGVTDLSGYGSRFYYPLGTHNVKLVCTPNPATGCYGQTLFYGPNDPYVFYNFTQADGRIQIQNELDANGLPQLQILQVN